MLRPIFYLLFLLAFQARAEQSLESFVFDEVPNGPHTNALLISQNGKIVFERYAHGYSAASRHILWSISKSVTGTLIGAAVKQGLLTTSDSICKGIEPKPVLPSCDVTVNDLLNWSSGLNWLEEYENSGDRTKSSVVQMLAGDGQHDMFQFLLHHPLGAKPGTRYRYSTADSTALMGVLKNVLKDQKKYDRWPWEAVFDPLNIKGVTFEQDPSGTFIGGSYVYMTGPDLVRLGEFWMRASKGQNSGILPQGWMTELLVPPPAFKKPGNKKLYFYPLRHFWRPLQAVDGQIPADAFSANGHWGQYVFVIPSLDLVVVRFGDDRNQPFQVKPFFRALMNHLYGKTAVTEGPSEGQSSEKPSLEEASPPPYSTWLPSLGTHYGTRLYCSCRFVIGQTEPYCQEYVKISPDILRVRTSDEAKKETAVSVLGFWQALAYHRSAELGCQLQK